MLQSFEQGWRENYGSKWNMRKARDKHETGTQTLMQNPNASFPLILCRVCGTASSIGNCGSVSPE